MAGKVFIDRTEKSLRHLAVVAKFLDDNKPKTSLLKWVRTVSSFIDVIQFNSICQILAKLSGVKSERTVSKFRKKKENFWDVLTYFVKRVIRKFYVAIMQRRLRNVHKSVMHVQSCFSDINHLLFSSSLCRSRRRCLSSPLLWSRNCASMVTWRHTSL